MKLFITKAHLAAVFSLFGVMLSFSVTTRAQEDLFYRVIWLGWSPSGQFLGIGDTLGRVAVQDILKQETKFNATAYRGRVFDVLWNSDETQFVSVGDGRVKIHDANTGQVLYTIEQEGFYYYLAYWLKKPNELLTIGGVEHNEIVVWDSITGKEINRYSTGIISDIVPSYDQTKLALAAFTHVSIQDSVTLQQTGMLFAEEIGGRGYDVLTIAWNPDDTKILTGALNGILRLWDVETQTMLFELQANTDPEIMGDYIGVRAVQFSPNGASFTSVHGDGTIRIWETATGKLLQESRIPEWVGAAAFSPYGGQLAYGVAQSLSDGNPSANNPQPTPDLLTLRAAPDVPSLQNGWVKIIVPDASLSQLQGIAADCAADTSADNLPNMLSASAVNQLEAKALPDFITQIEALPEGAIPSACAADLIAVAEAIIAQA